MVITLTGEKKDQVEFSYPYRMLISGSSGSGKTFFAEKLLSRADLFEKRIEKILYFYPSFIDERPVKWDTSLDIPISYRRGLPKKEDIIDLKPHTTLVIDDNYDKAINCSFIDHLFRVMSRKRIINIILITQNNFMAGRYGRNIRNSCNFTVLMRNSVDERINRRVANQMGLLKAFKTASEMTKHETFPYMFIDQTPLGNKSDCRFYVDIFASVQKVICNNGEVKRIIRDDIFQKYFAITEMGRKFEATRIGIFHNVCYKLTQDWKEEPQHDTKFKSKRKRRYSSASEGRRSLSSESLSFVSSRSESSSSESSSSDSPISETSSEDDFPGQKHSYWKF